jgi:outer membrane protein assembly factor BamB
MKKTVGLLGLFIFGWLHMAAAITPEEIAQRSGIKRGLVVLPGTRDATLASGLAGAGYVVYALCPSEEIFQQLSKTFIDQGTLGQRVYLEVGSAADIPVQRLADIVYVERLPQDKAPLMKMLAPRRGVLLTADGQAFVCPAPDGGDQWRHRLHSPDNRRVSSDQLINPDHLVSQWYGLPLKEGFWGTTEVSAGGRVYTIAASRDANDPAVLVARSLHNGCELWRHSYGSDKNKGNLKAGIYGGRSMIAAGDKEVWLADGADLRVIDGESGKELRKIEGPVPGGQIKWIALFDGTVAVLAGVEDSYRRLQYQMFVNNPAGAHLAVYRLDGTKVWEKEFSGTVDEREIAARNGTIYLQVQGAGTTALSLADGKVVWNNPETAALVDSTSGDIDRLLVSDRAMMVDSNALILAASWKTNLVSLDPATGQILWHKPIGKTSRSLAAVLKNGVWYGTEFLDARTGKPIANKGKIPQSICSVDSCVGSWFMTAFGDFYTINGLKQVRYADQRTPCDMGNVVADGTLFGNALQCTCATDIHGFRTAGIMDIPLHQAGPWKERLNVFSAAEPASLNLSAEDWPTHRHDSSRSGSTPVKIGAKPGEQWAFVPAKTADKPEGFLSRPLSSAAVHGAGKTWFIDVMGVLNCIDTQTGKLVWKQIIGARSFAPPTLYKGTVFVGDMAGMVHAFSAVDGKPLWRFQAAPLRQKMLWYGQLASLWPCTGGVVVDNGTLYVVAGYQESNGIHAYALDPSTGQVIWENHAAGTGGDRGIEAAFGNYGHIATGGGRLWLASSSFYPGSFSLKDGSIQTAPCMMDHHFYGRTMRRGADVGILNGTFVMVGGMRLSTQQELPEQIIKGDGYNVLSVNPPTVPDGLKDKSFYGLDMINNSTTTPAWDDELMVAAISVTAMPARKPSAWKTAAVAAQIQAEFDRGMDPSDRDKYQQRSLGADSKNKNQSSSPENPVWSNSNIKAVEVVLCANAVLVIHADFKKDVQVSQPWYLSALDRESGAEQWRITLPSKPRHDGLSVAAGGKIIVVFDDGGVRGYW